MVCHPLESELLAICFSICLFLLYELLHCSFIYMHFTGTDSVVSSRYVLL